MSFIKTFIRFLLTFLLAGLVGVGFHDYLENFDSNECSMTYMLQPPNLIPVDLPTPISDKYPNYKLYLYCEGTDCEKYESLEFKTPGQIPVLFVTGNADSHLQVRSIASVALDKSRRRPKNKFHFFTISFNEELTALYGPLLKLQTEYARHCIEHILKLFINVPEDKRPKSVLVIGNSMGGVISRGIVSKLDENDKFYKKNLVHTIITQAAPHNRPVISMDLPLMQYYDKINHFWLNKSETSLKNVVLVSTYGGTRDILVRNGLANINKWKSKSSAGIISAYSGSIPHVWRSIDHRCMSWCKELILVVSRALFDMIDLRTGQLIENRFIREQILKNRFIQETSIETADSNVVAPTQNLSSASTQLIDQASTINYEFNGFINEEKLVVFSLNDLVNEKKFDSLFIYSNFNTKSSFYLCKKFTKSNGDLLLNDQHECSDPKDLFRDYGRTIPPLQSGISIININDINSLILDEKYTHLVFKFPILLEKMTIRQLFVKFDWYLRKDRVKILELPNFINREKAFEASNVPFQRYYLPALQNVLEAYNFRKVSNSSCDIYLHDLMLNLPMEQKPLSSSNLLMQFYEPISQEQTRHHSEQIYHTQLIPYQTKGLSFKLSVNQRLTPDTIPYIDLFRIDPKHLIHHMLVDSTANDVKEKCSAATELFVEVSFNSIAGQFSRFFLIFLPAFIAAILQYYDYLIIKLSKKETSEHSNGFLILNRLQSCFGCHLVFSLLIASICYVLQTNMVNNLIHLYDPLRVYLPTNDLQQLDREGIYNNFLSILLYWAAYAVISTATVFLSVLVNLLSKIINKIVFRLFKILNFPIFHKLFSLAHLAFTVFIGFFTSGLANVTVFYAETIKLATFYSVHSIDYEKYYKNSLIVCLQQTRVLLVYLLLILNLPSVIVWTKSFNADIQPLYALKGDSGVLVAVINVILFLVNYFKTNSEFINNLFRMPKSVLTKAIMINCILTVLYSTVNLYRLQYFILIHLTLMSFYSVQRNQSFNLIKDATKAKNE